MLKAFQLTLVLFFSMSTLNAQQESTPPSSPIASDSWLVGGAHSPNENLQTSAPLPHPNVREADILWEKRVWRVVDTREKINLPFRHPEKGLFDVINQGLKSNHLTAYSPEDDHFSTRITAESIESKLNSVDTAMIYDMDNEEYTPQVVINTFDPDRIKRWRIQEVWYFDNRHSNMQVRIIGIAPMVESQSEHENAPAFEIPLFWINYEEARPWLAQNSIVQFGNDHSQMSWEDLFAMRRFSSHIYKENDMLGRRLQDYTSGEDLLIQGEKIEQKIQNFEQDVWSY